MLGHSSSPLLFARIVKIKSSVKGKLFASTAWLFCGRTKYRTQISCLLPWGIFIIATIQCLWNFSAGVTWCYGLRMWTSCACVEILALDGKMLGGGALGWWLGHGGGAHVNGINALIIEAPESLLVLSTMWEHAKKALSRNPDRSTWQTPNLPSPWSQTSQPLELWEIIVLYFCYSSTNGWKHLGIMLNVGSDSADLGGGWNSASM
jgi:hypothetical protein